MPTGYDAAHDLDWGYRWNLGRPEINNTGVWAKGVRFIAFFYIMTVAWGGVSSTCWAEIDSRQIIKKGTVQLGLQTGYWQANTGIGNADSSNRSAVFFLPQIGYTFTDEFKAWYFSGAWDIILEPVGAHFIKPFSASLFGASVVFKYNFLSFGRWMPYWDTGWGLAWTDLAPRIPEQSSQFTFMVETGIGTHYFLTQRAAVNVGFRFHHLSDAGIGDRNVGINAWMGLVGVSYYFP